MSRHEDKANALVAAWKDRYAGALPSKHAVIMCCAVAEHETNCGDAWCCSPHSNRGLVTVRPTLG